ncbi:MAG TPA: hypothetical protein EYG72_01020 [Candidatus Pacebacteria bacterium]|nr:hypothetical protein [Candidatus Paceibacterota bacterium]
MNENIKKISSVFDGKEEYERFSIKTQLINEGDDIKKIFMNITKSFVQDGDIVMVAESPIAITEGRAYKFSEIKYGF